MNLNTHLQATSEVPKFNVAHFEKHYWWGEASYLLLFPIPDEHPFLVET